ncbi:hypothetical protein PR202_gb03680 [Eleusine coracana subsp. coracana]|uniref:DUF2828 domain-containing protein n=1 Tax=Eleusine coracana subsp. coracana TaxID=191504 RepID=A0AAV5E2G6_ELECO|nr:hypothetical protein PR202_gb03680 [Eleusine coracana subsp. coracana]
MAAADSESASVRRRGSPVWSTFTNPCLRLFMVNAATPPERLLQALSAAWDHDPLTALKLVCQLRAMATERATASASTPPRSGCMRSIPTPWPATSRHSWSSGTSKISRKFYTSSSVAEILYRLVRQVGFQS